MRNTYLSLLIFLAPIGVRSQSNAADCSGGIRLCSKNLISIPALTSSGELVSELSTQICYPSKPFIETNSIWLKWEIADPGSLSFTILPQNEHDDFDFVLFKSPDGNTLCENLEAVRCMRAGPTLGEDGETSGGCTGATGLSDLSTDINRPTGCSIDIANFLSPVDTKSGDIYTLLINNYHSTSGFALGFDGTSTFRPEFGDCSPVVSSVIEEPSSGFTITNAYPNPASDNVFVDITSKSSFDVTAQIISTDGVLVDSRSVFVNEGSSSFSLPVESLISGVYFLKIRSANHTVISRFYKQ